MAPTFGEEVPSSWFRSALKRGSWSPPVGSPNIRGRGAPNLSMPLLCTNGNRGRVTSPQTPHLEPPVSHFPLIIQGRYALVVYCLKPRIRERQGATVKEVATGENHSELYRRGE